MPPSVSLDGWWQFLTGVPGPATGAALAAALDVSLRDKPALMITAPPLTAPPTPWPKSRAQSRAGPIDRPSGLGHITLTLTPDQLATGLPLGAHRRTPPPTCGTHCAGIPPTPSISEPASCRVRATVCHQSLIALPCCTRWVRLCILAAPYHATPHRPSHPTWDDCDPTDLTNLVPICHFHHCTVHRGKLAITRPPSAAGTATPHQPGTIHMARDRAGEGRPDRPEKLTRSPSDGVRQRPRPCAPRHRGMPSSRHTDAHSTARARCARLARCGLRAEPLPQVVLQNRRERIREKPKDDDDLTHDG